MINIERDVEQDQNGTWPCVRVVMSIGNETFRSKWLSDTGQTDEWLKCKALQEYQAKLRLNLNDVPAADLIKAGVENDRRSREAEQLVAASVRPSTRPEIVASINQADGHDRHYRIVARRDADEVRYFAVYDIPADGVLGCQHEGPFDSYDAAAAAIGLIVERFPHWTERLGIYDQFAKFAHDQRKADKEREARETAERLERERREAALAAEQLESARREIFGTVPPSKKASEEVFQGEDRRKVNGWRIGHFFVGRNDEMPRTPRYEVWHLPTGLSAGHCKRLEEAKILAGLLQRRGKWDFTDAKRMPRESLNHASKVRRLFQDGAWHELVTYLKGMDTDVREAKDTCVTG